MRGSRVCYWNPRMRNLALVLVAVLGFGCGDNEDLSGPVIISRVDRMVVPLSSSGVACWGSPLLDEDPAAAGLQPACSATFLFADGSDGLLPMCDGSNEVCWRLVDDSQCPVTSLSLAIDTQDAAIPAGATATIECVLDD